MKILLRRHNGEEYVWKTAKYDKNGFNVDGYEVQIDNIVSVMNDNRKNYVRCKECGEIIKNTESAISKHRHRTETSKSCIGCMFMVAAPQPSRKKLKYKKMADGTYVKDEKQVVKLFCNAGWTAVEIDDDKARSQCIFNGCTNAEMLKIEDTFTLMPGVFDDIATINAIDNVGCDLDRGYVRGGYTYYKLAFDAANYGVYAGVNNLGIIDHIKLASPMADRKIYYSKKYDMMFYAANERYSLYYMPDDDDTRELKANLRKLYT